MKGVDVKALVKACTGKGLCPMLDYEFKCPQTIECQKTTENHWTKHLIKSVRIRTALQKAFPKDDDED